MQSRRQDEGWKEPTPPAAMENVRGTMANAYCRSHDDDDSSVNGYNAYVTLLLSISPLFRIPAHPAMPAMPTTGFVGFLRSAIRA